ncbi:MAG: glycosyltransferase family 2 protein [Candidatus Scalindua rubra]|uniref:Glycosyltransferase family 2 n=1 Tax=Candidatus Scalindua brodae TaxID=237368 RepID=A0A0B0EDA5_9BACT|nr:MAG: glycosyltransferase family 2 [Candidatus Scalindua brodae]MBZ0107151.1 glycosyltransferase family 2 protein [Candidatus Scalindua rubra]TWU38080.1 UDP-Glc:alpha-D-GlcNAc-diphosphoundecaprenol beta-1,3-glucosyltransferase WfgD [Candidatus Brocadiaceae bacterium S225]
MPTVSVIIHTYNNEKFIAETVESVLNQTYKDYEIIVVDDGSVDATRDALLPYMHGIRYHYKENGGIASAKNAGISLSQAEFIAFLDHDDLWAPDKLRLQMECFNENPQVGLVYAKYTSFRDGKDLRTKPEKGYSGWIFKELLSKSFIQTSTVIVKRECLDAVGPYDESFSLGDEYDMFLRISNKFQCGFVDKGLTRYRVHDTNASNDDFLFDNENLGVYKKIYNNFTDLDGEEKKILRKRIAGYSMKVAEGLYRQGKLEESKQYQKEANNYLPFYKRLTGNLIFKT